MDDVSSTASPDRSGIAPASSDCRHFAETNPQSAWMTDGGGAIIRYNQRWFAFTGTTPHETKGRGWGAAHRPDHIARVTARHKGAFATRAPRDDTLPLQRRDGRYRWFLPRPEPMRNEAGVTVRWFGTDTDVTDQRDAEATLRRSEESFRTLIHASAGLIWTASPEGGLIPPLPAWCAYTGQTEAEHAGWGWLDVVHPEDRTRVADFWTECVSGDPPFHIEYRPSRRDGAWRYRGARAAPVLAPGGKMRDWVGVNASTTDRRQAEDALVDAKELAEGAGRAKSQFIASTSHELRTPLSAVIGYSEMLGEEIEDWGQIHLLSNLREIEAGRTTVEAVDFEIGAMLDEVVSARGALEVILLDGEMPEMEGRSALHAMRHDPALADIVVTMISAKSEQGLAFALGATDDPLKPIDWDRLKRVVERMQPHKDATVLVIDDDADARERMRFARSRESWSVVEAGYGRHALERLDGMTPSLILLDLMMPVMGGFAFIEKLRQRPGGGPVPVVVLTAKDVTPEERTCLDRQADRIIARGSLSLPELAQDLRSPLPAVDR